MYRSLTGLKPFILSVTCLSLLFTQVIVHADEVNVYSARKEALILPLLKKFRAETGIGFNLITAKADTLLKRIEAEGQSTPADVFITTDAGRLQRARAAGVLQSVDNPVLAARIPANLRDKDNYWFGLSQRARIIFYAKDKVAEAELSTYEALADEKWKHRVCIRSSDNIYNQSLVASMIEANGEDQTEAWARALVLNLGRSPAGGDRDLRDRCAHRTHAKTLRPGSPVGPRVSGDPSGGRIDAPGMHRAHGLGVHEHSIRDVFRCRVLSGMAAAPGHDIVLCVSQDILAAHAVRS